MALGESVLTLSNSGDDFMGSIYVSIKKEEDTEFNDLFNA